MKLIYIVYLQPIGAKGLIFNQLDPGILLD
jgi:hypothetical protein